jgi:hypothetical protein
LADTTLCGPATSKQIALVTTRLKVLEGRMGAPGVLVPTASTLTPRPCANVNCRCRVNRFWVNTDYVLPKEALIRRGDLLREEHQGRSSQVEPLP